MSVVKSLFYGFVIASVINVFVFVTLALGVGYQIEWAYTPFAYGLYFWPLATMNFLLLGFVLGRIIWDWQNAPSREALAEIRRLQAVRVAD